MAIVTAHSALNMVSPGISYGTLTSYDASQITITVGVDSATYYGSFTYSAYGLSGGTITGYTAYTNGVVSGTVTNGNVNALTYYSYLNYPDPVGAYTYVFRGADIVNGSAFADQIRGFGNADALYGNGGADIIRGDGGVDTIVGGAGNDTLTGGDGADRFVFANKPNSSSNHDTITDFVHGNDHIVLDDDVFTALGQGGTRDLGAANFRAGAAQDSNDFIVYNKSTGLLYYDADGSGAGKAIPIAKLGVSSHPTLSAADIDVTG
jgi:Ca2+-binding RTX toxin-like protein